MTVLDIALDVLARLPDESGRKVRALVSILDPSSPPAEIRLVADHQNGVEEIRRDEIRSIVMATEHHWTVHRTDDTSFVLDVIGGCRSCGGGRLSIMDPTPGYERRMVRVPLWLKEIPS